MSLPIHEISRPTAGGNSIQYTVDAQGAPVESYGVNHAGQRCRLTQDATDRLGAYFIAQDIADKIGEAAKTARAEINRMGGEEHMMTSSGVAGFMPFIERCHKKEAEHAQCSALAETHFQYVAAKADETIGKLQGLSSLFAQEHATGHIVADPDGAARIAPRVNDGGVTLG